MNISKGQVAVELLVVLGFVLAIFIPIIFFAYTRSAHISKSVADIYTVAAVQRIANGVEMVYASGNGSSVRFVINIPDSVENISYVSRDGGSLIVANLTDGSNVISVTKGKIDVKKSNMLKRGTYTLYITMPDQESEGIIITTK